MTIVPLSTDVYERVIHLRPSADQEKWSGTAATTLVRAKQNPAQHVFVMNTDEGEPGGLFVLDENPFAPIPGADLQLHSFFVDQNMQGKGLATRSIIEVPSLVREHFPDKRLLVLVVNVQNPIAYRLYRVHGFTEWDRKYLGGSNGPEHMLFMSF